MPIIELRSLKTLILLHVPFRGNTMNKMMITTAILVGLGASANSTAKVTFELQDSSIETQLCAIAGEHGLKAARNFAKSKRADYNTLALTVTCNGYSLTNFSKKYATPQFEAPALLQEQAVIPVSLVTGKSNPASQLCIDAVTLGESAARQKHGIKNDHVTCNDRPLKTFVASFAKRDIVVDERN